MRKSYVFLIAFAFLFVISSQSTYSAICGVEQNITQVSVFANSSSINEPRDLFIENDIAYIPSANSDSLTTLNVSDPENLVQMHEIAHGTRYGGAWSVAVQRGVAYVVMSNNARVTSVNVSDPHSLVELDSFSPSGSDKRDVDIVDNVLYTVSYDDNRVTSVDISDPSNMFQLDSISSALHLNETESLDLVKDFLHTGTGPSYDKYTLVSILDSKDLVIEDQDQDNTQFDGITDIVSSGGVGYMVMDGRDSIASINISDPDDNGDILIQELRNTSVFSGVSSMFEYGDFIFTVSTVSPFSLVVVNKSNPAAMTIVEVYENATTGSINNPRDIEIYEGMAYVTNEGSNDQIVVLNVSCYTDLYEPPKPPQSPAILKNVQSGTFSWSSAGNQYVELPNSVNRSSSMLFYSTATFSDGVLYSKAIGYLKNDTHLSFKRHSGGTNNTHVTWYVAEFDSGVRVQHGEKYQSKDSLYGITPINMSSTFLMGRNIQSANTWDDNDFIKFELDPEGAVQSTIGENFNNNVSYQVVEYNGANVQHGVYNLSSAVTSVTDINISSVNISKSFIPFSGRISGLNTPQNLFSANFTDSSNIGFHKRTTSSRHWEVSWQAVEFTGNENVYSGVEYFDNELSKNVTLPSSINTSASVVFLSGPDSMAPASEGSQKHYVSMFTSNLTNSTNLWLNRSAIHGDNSDAWVQWFIIEFDNNVSGIGGGGGGGSGSIDPPSISYVSPTPSDGSSLTSGSSTTINTTITSTTNTSAFINWTNDLRGYWNFETTNATHVFDISGNGFDGVFANGTTTSNASGVRGTYASFDGVDDSIILKQDSAYINEQSAVTISLWVYPEVLEQRSIFGIGTDEDGVNSRVSIALLNDNIQALARSYRESSYVSFNTTDSPIAADEWHHIAATFDFANDNITIYHNGVERVGNLGGSFTYPVTNNSNSVHAVLGSDEKGGSSFFNGRLDEAMLFSRILTHDEIRALHNASSTNNLERSFSSLSPGSYSFQACVIDTEGQFACAQSRSLTVNSTVLGGVEYVFPTLPNGSKYSGDSFTITYGNGSADISTCSVEINSQVYAAAYSSGYCSYTYTFTEDIKTTINFQASYNNSNSNLPARYFTYYPTPEVATEVDGFGIGSVITSSLLLLWGLLGG